MTDFADGVASMRARFAAMWPAVHADVPILWPNERLDPAPDPSATGNGKQGWVAFTVRGGPEALKGFGGLGNNLYRQSGEVLIRCFVPTASTEIALRQLCSDAAAIYRGWQDGNLKFFAAGTIGEPVEDGGWAELDVQASFTFDFVA